MLEMNLQLFAHKKGMGSTKNGRDSESKRLGAKRADGQFVLAGNILYRLCNVIPRYACTCESFFHGNQFPML